MILRIKTACFIVIDISAIQRIDTFTTSCIQQERWCSEPRVAEPANVGGELLLPGIVLSHVCKKNRGAAMIVEDHMPELLQPMGSDSRHSATHVAHRRKTQDRQRSSRRLGGLRLLWLLIRKVAGWEMRYQLANHSHIHTKFIRKNGCRAMSRRSRRGGRHSHASAK